MNMTASDVSPGRTYKYLNDSSYALWPFGYGLSYTEFALSNLVADKTWHVGGLKDSFHATITVTNIGSVAGDEVVFLFLNASAAVRNNSNMFGCLFAFNSCPSIFLLSARKKKNRKPTNKQTKKPTLTRHSFGTVIRWLRSS